MPALQEAENALKVLEKKDLDFLKAMKSPPTPVRVVLQALCLIMYPNPTEKKKNPETLRVETAWWEASIKLLGNTRLLDEMLKFDRDGVAE